MYARQHSGQARIISGTAPYPGERFAGRGIVICAGGPRLYRRMAKRAVNVIAARRLEALLQGLGDPAAALLLMRISLATPSTPPRPLRGAGGLPSHARQHRT
jgi:hypothetical protein